MTEKRRHLDDWGWFLKCYWMVLFAPFRYMKEIIGIRKGRRRNKW